MMKKKWFSALLSLILLLGSAVGLAAPVAAANSSAGAVLAPSTPGTKTEKNASAVIDYSNAKDGYVMLKWTGDKSAKVAVQVKGPKNAEKYTYYLCTGG